MNLFALADRKRMLVSDLYGLSIDDIQEYIAYYQIEAEEIEENGRRANPHP
jgi:hypothetical protein